MTSKTCVGAAGGQRQRGDGHEQDEEQREGLLVEDVHQAADGLLAVAVPPALDLLADELHPGDPTVPGMRAAAVIAALVGGSVLLADLAPAYDPWAWLLWGREVADGTLSTAEGPAFKPLPVAVATLLAPLGGAAPWLWVLRRAGGDGRRAGARLAAAPACSAARGRAASPARSPASTASGHSEGAAARAARSAPGSRGSATAARSRSRLGVACGAAARRGVAVPARGRRGAGAAGRDRRAARRRRGRRARRCGSCPSTSAPATCCAPATAPASRTPASPRSPTSRCWASLREARRSSSPWPLWLGVALAALRRRAALAARRRGRGLDRCSSPLMARRRLLRRAPLRAARAPASSPSPAALGRRDRPTAGTCRPDGGWRPSRSLVARRAAAARGPGRRPRPRRPTSGDLAARPARRDRARPAAATPCSPAAPRTSARCAAR